MNLRSSLSARLIPTLAIVVLLVLPDVARTEPLEFRVAMEDLPGVDELQTGKLLEGIHILEQDLEPGQSRTWGRTMATLCGAYILHRDFPKAMDACESAVAEAPGETAFNNRGVLRVYMGDLDGALEDFDRARPEDTDEYLELIRRTDPRLVAVGNTRALAQLRASSGAMKSRETLMLNPATIEDVMN